MTGTRPRREAADLMAAIEGVRADGLDPADYDLEALAALRTEKSKNPFCSSASSGTSATAACAWKTRTRSRSGC